jgi:hypothetical protein
MFPPERFERFDLPRTHKVAVVLRVIQCTFAARANVIDVMPISQL